MPTSLKSTLESQRGLASKFRKNPLQGMHQIKAKVTVFQQQYDHLLQQRQQDIAKLISTLDLATLEDQTLVGALLFIKDQVSAQDKMLEVWQDAGERFLRRSKSKKNSSSQQTQASPPKAQSSQKSSNPRDQ